MPLSLGATDDENPTAVGRACGPILLMADGETALVADTFTSKTSIQAMAPLTSTQRPMDRGPIFRPLRSLRNEPVKSVSFSADGETAIAGAPAGNGAAYIYNALGAVGINGSGSQVYGSSSPTFSYTATTTPSAIQPDCAMRQPMGVAPRVAAADRDLPRCWAAGGSLRGFVLVDQGTSATLATVMVQAPDGEGQGLPQGADPPTFALGRVLARWLPCSAGSRPGR
jgi:hypothetical protein